MIQLICSGALHIVLPCTVKDEGVVRKVSDFGLPGCDSIDPCS
jgi:hypothetical protein